jgi:AcrR family transcriptional regulator
MAQRMTKQRARSDDDKALRRASLVESARRQLRADDWGSLRVEDVARGAGVAKASVFRYFRTKEELVLEVFLLELADVFATLGLELARSPVMPPPPRAVARIMARTIADRPLFTRLAAALHAVQARNISVDAAKRFKHGLHQLLSAGGVALESAISGVPPGAGIRVLLRFHATIIGVWQLADCPPNVAQAIDETGLDVFKIDFADEIEKVFVSLLQGLEVPS